MRAGQDAGPHIAVASDIVGREVRSGMSRRILIFRSLECDSDHFLRDAPFAVGFMSTARSTSAYAAAPDAPASEAPAPPAPEAAASEARAPPAPAETPAPDAPAPEAPHPLHRGDPRTRRACIRGTRTVVLDGLVLDSVGELVARSDLLPDVTGLFTDVSAPTLGGVRVSGGRRHRIDVAGRGGVFGVVAECSTPTVLHAGTVESVASTFFSTGSGLFSGYRRDRKGGLRQRVRLDRRATRLRETWMADGNGVGDRSEAATARHRCRFEWPQRCDASSPIGLGWPRMWADVVTTGSSRPV